MSVQRLKFSFDFDAKIWKSAFSFSENKILLELRNEQTWDVKYCFVDLLLGSLQELNFKADWWTSLLTIRGSYIFFEKIIDPQNPLSKDLLVFNFKKSELDTYSDFDFIDLDEGKIIGCKPGAAEIGKEISFDGFSIEEDKCRYPVSFSPQSSGGQMIAEYLESVSTQGQFEYLEFGDFIIISYHVSLGTKFARKLLVIAGDAEIYQDTIDEHLEGLALDSFIVFENLLIFVKNSYQLNAIEL